MSALSFSVMFDTDSGKVIPQLPIGSGVDGGVFHDATQLVFASCGEGVTVFARKSSPSELLVVQKLK